MLGSNLLVAGFSWVHSSSPSVSFGVVGYIRVHPGCRWVHSCAHCVSLGSFRVVGLVRVRNWGRWVHSVSLGSFGCALGVV